MWGPDELAAMQGGGGAAAPAPVGPRPDPRPYWQAAMDGTLFSDEPNKGLLSYPFRAAYTIAKGPLWALGAPARAIRTGITGGDWTAAAVNTDPAIASSGVDVNHALFGMDNQDTGFLGHMAGFGAELATDPLIVLGGGLTKAGRSAAEAAMARSATLTESGIRAGVEGVSALSRGEALARNTVEHGAVPLGLEGTLGGRMAAGQSGLALRNPASALTGLVGAPFRWAGMQDTADALHAFGDWSYEPTMLNKAIGRGLEATIGGPNAQAAIDMLNANPVSGGMIRTAGAVGRFLQNPNDNQVFGMATRRASIQAKIVQSQYDRGWDFTDAGGTGVVRHLPGRSETTTLLRQTFPVQKEYDDAQNLAAAVAEMHIMPVNPAILKDREEEIATLAHIPQPEVRGRQFKWVDPKVQAYYDSTFPRLSALTDEQVSAVWGAATQHFTRENWALAAMRQRGIDAKQMGETFLTAPARWQKMMDLADEQMPDAQAAVASTEPITKQASLAYRRGLAGKPAEEGAAAAGDPAAAVGGDTSVLRAPSERQIALRAKTLEATGVKPEVALGQAAHDLQEEAKAQAAKLTYNLTPKPPAAPLTAGDLGPSDLKWLYKNGLQNGIERTKVKGAFSYNVSNQEALESMLSEHEIDRAKFDDLRGVKSEVTEIGGHVMPEKAKPDAVTREDRFVSEAPAASVEGALGEGGRQGLEDTRTVAAADQVAQKAELLKLARAEAPGKSDVEILADKTLVAKIRATMAEKGLVDTRAPVAPKLTLAELEANHLAAKETYEQAVQRVRRLEAMREKAAVELPLAKIRAANVPGHLTLTATPEAQLAIEKARGPQNRPAGIANEQAAPRGFTYGSGELGPPVSQAAIAAKMKNDEIPYAEARDILQRKSGRAGVPMSIPAANYEVLHGGGTTVTGGMAPESTVGAVTIARALITEKGSLVAARDLLKDNQQAAAFAHYSLEEAGEQGSQVIRQTITREALRDSLIGNFACVQQADYRAAVKVAMQTKGTIAEKMQAAEKAFGTAVKDSAAKNVRFVDMLTPEAKEARNVADFHAAIQGPGAYVPVPDFYQGKPYYVPLKAHEGWTAYLQAAQPQRAGPVMAALTSAMQSYLSWWKPWQARYWPSAQIRYQVQDNLLMMQKNIYTASTPGYQRALFMLESGLTKPEDFSINVAGRQWNGYQVWDMLKARLGVGGQGQEQQMIRDVGAALPREGTVGALMAKNPAARAVLAVRDKFAVAAAMREDINRYAGVLSLIDQGTAPEAAAMKVETALFNYARISPAADFLRKTGLAPFAAWSAKNIPAQVAWSAENPGLAAAAINGMNGILNGVPENLVSQSLKDKFNINTGYGKDARTGRPTFGVLTMDGLLPFTDLTEWARAPGDQARRMLGPMWKVLADAYNARSPQAEDRAGPEMLQDAIGKPASVVKEFWRSAWHGGQADEKYPNRTVPTFPMAVLGQTLSPLKYHDIDIGDAVKKSDLALKRLVGSAQSELKQAQIRFNEASQFPEVTGGDLPGYQQAIAAAQVKLQQAKGQQARTGAENQRILQTAQQLEKAP